MRKRLGVYEKSAIDKLIGLIQSVDGHELNVRSLMRDMQMFVSHFALPEHLNEEQRLWAEFLSADKTKASDSVRALKRLLKAQNPLAKGECREGLKPSLNAKLAKRFEQRRRQGMSATRPNLACDNWKDLSDAERDEVFKAIEELLVYYKQQLSRGRPSKDKLDTALWSVLGIWAEQTGSQDAIDEAPYEVPHKENSRFIQFASIAMQPCGDGTETTQIALSRRWGRMKKAPKSKLKRTF